MSQLNSITVVPRHNRPATEERVELQMHYVVGGGYSDPYEVSSVHIFKDTTSSSTEFPYITNGLPENLLDLQGSSVRYGLVASSMYDDSIFRFAAPDTLVTSTSYDNSGYSLDASAASGVYRADNYDEGVFSVVLRPGISGTEEDGSSKTIAASGLQVGNYFDIWTLRNTETGSLVTYVHTFSLSQDSVVTFTEPLDIVPSVKMRNRYVQIGSEENLVFGVNLGLANKNMSLAEKNIFRDSVIRDAQVRIVKLNEESNLDSRYEVSGFADTAASTRVTSHDDVMFLWDTAALTAIANATEGYGLVSGKYEIQLKFTLLTETILSQRFIVVLR